jgi:hypothetical protein
VPKPGQVITVAGNYRPYDPSLDTIEDSEAEGDTEAHRASDGDVHHSNASDDEKVENEHKDATSQTGSDGGSVCKGSDEGRDEGVDADLEGQGEEKSEEGSDAGYQDLPPPESDDESTGSVRWM